MNDSILRVPDLNRAYGEDFDVYNERSANPDDAEVDVFLSMNNERLMK